jgi:GNAT superfamily N-acetyltransferase
VQNAESGRNDSSGILHSAFCTLHSPQSPAPNPQSPPAALVVFDEFTSVVDRTVAQVGSAAVAKAIRSGRIAKRFVAVSCHYDILPWLEPDWVADMATCTLKRGRLRRPSITLEVVRCRQSAWRLFARHHYLSGSIPCFAQCYLALWNGEPVAFCAVTGMYGYRNRKRVARTVTLPDYQGLGIGTRLMERVCEHESERGFLMTVTTSHPAMIAYGKSSPRWRTIRVKKTGNRPPRKFDGKYMTASLGRSVVSFEFIPRVEGQESRVESRKSSSAPSVDH